MSTPLALFIHPKILLLKNVLPKGSRGYENDFSYVSHAHGWSAGPTSALTEFVLGLSVTGRVGSTWQFAPQFGSDLTFAEGGFTTSLGKFSASWTTDNTTTNIMPPSSKNSSNSSGGGYMASVKTPTGTVGQFVLPVVEQGVLPTVVVDGVQAGNVTWARKTGVVFDTVLISDVNGGNHTIVVS